MSLRTLQDNDKPGASSGYSNCAYVKEAPSGRDGNDVEVRVLSYNFNLLPRGCGGFQSERINTFLKHVNDYDVLLFQEVYAATVLPYFVQKRICFQKRLVDELRERGFVHYVISKQPSYRTILRHNVHSDNGLIIASRFPIKHRGSYTFCGNEHMNQSLRRGCLFAEVMVPSAGNENVSMLFFNVHLRPEEGVIATSSQVLETRRFIDSVIGNMYTEYKAARNIPLVVAGDFNINAIDLHSGEQTTKVFTDLLKELQPLGTALSEVIYDTHGYHPPTRPSRLFFPSQSKLNRDLLTPQRQDFLFVSPGVDVHLACIQKFISSSRRPYVHISDHFGVSATLSVSASASEVKTNVHSTLSTKPLPTISMAGETVHEHSNPLLSIRMEFISLLLLACTAMRFSKLTLCVLGIICFLLWWFSSRARVLSHEREFTAMPNTMPEGKETVSMRHSKEYEILHQVKDLADMWHQAVYRHKALRCLGQKNDAGEPEWLTYAAVDAKVRELGSGLSALGVAPGDVIGVDCQASRNAIILELACITYGFTTLSLVGKSNNIRNLIDGHNVKVAFASRGAVASLLTCRSHDLETVVSMHSFYDVADNAVARDVGITLISFDEICHKGRSQPKSPLPRVDSDTALSLVVDTITTYDSQKIVRITHADVLRDISTLVATSVLPTSRRKHLAIQFMPFAMMFNRIFILGLFAHGSSIATSEGANRHAFLIFHPTLLLAVPSLFATSAIQLKRKNDRYGPLYCWLFEKVYQLRSLLINEHSRDSSVLRYLFFDSFQRQLGGCVEKIVLSVTEESVSYSQVEHIALCYAPCVREVFFLPSEGVFCVDGALAPGVRVELEPLDEPSKKAIIGQLTLIRNDETRHELPLAAKLNEDKTLRLMGPPRGILLPLKGEYVVAAELERIFAQSRYVNDIFLYAQPSRPIIAIVSPNRDIVEYEWQQQQQQYQASIGAINNSNNNDGTEGDTVTVEGAAAANDDGAENLMLNWTDLARYASKLLLADFLRIGKSNGLHASHVPGLVHLHPHPFNDHEGFLTPYGGLRRDSVTHYFQSVINRFYCDSESPAIHTPGYTTTTSSNSSDDDSVGGIKPTGQFILRVPIVIDIGGTFAKFLYVQPPGVNDIPDYVKFEPSSLSERLNLQTFKFFVEGKKLKEKSSASFSSSFTSPSPSSMVGKIRFAKLPSIRVPDFFSYLGKMNVLENYSEEYRGGIRATGGGAFKFASLVKKELNASFEVMREMDAVVQGLVLVIRSAPWSIFTVDPPTGIHHPHKLYSPPGEPLAPFPCLVVNIGSGISIIKCTGSDGSHVRVGGSPIGGATFWGLVRTMTNLTSWEEVIEIMRLDGPGDNKNVDLLVGDIYGYNAKDLPAMLSVDTVASTFGKFGADRFYEAMAGTTSRSFSVDDVDDVISSLPDQTSPSSPTNALCKEKKKPSAIDIVRSLLNMISGNVTQLAYLHSRVQNVQNIFFTGGFVRENPIIWSHISTTLQYWSKGECHAHFLEYDGYLGVLGSATMQSDAQIGTK